MGTLKLQFAQVIIFLVKTNKHNTENNMATAMEKGFVCTECSKKFTQMDNLKVHQRLHTAATSVPTSLQQTVI